MGPTEFRDAALVLVAHGSTANPDSARPAYLHADELRRRGVFAEVTEAFWKQEPPVWSVLRGVFAPRVFIVPLFIAEGWFTEQVIPLALGFRRDGAPEYSRIREHGNQVLHYCAAVGSHPAMTGVLLARAREVVDRNPFPRTPKPSETTLIIAGHGTSYAPGSRDSIERQVALIRETGAYAQVLPAFLEEDPFVADCWNRASTNNLVLVPYFISNGLHTAEDIPVMLGEPEIRVRERLSAGRPTWRNPTERQGKRLWLAGAVGTEPLVADVILERVRESMAAGLHRRSSASTGA
ncbi:MAG: CbiX/SirB N-terminal domain-containing protein [Limisphaerales bacterium]